MPLTTEEMAEFEREFAAEVDQEAKALLAALVREFKKKGPPKDDEPEPRS
jgi:hypothetical protein